MDRVVFHITEKGRVTTISCLLNPEKLEIRRSVGVTRTKSGQLINNKLTDDPILYTGRGSTEFTVELLFDVQLGGSTIQVGNDVRSLTRPLWNLAEYKFNQTVRTQLPLVRFVWAKAWNIPVAIASIAERFERFTSSGVPQRSWLTMGLWRTSDEVPPIHEETLYSLTNMPAPATLEPEAESWGTHQYVAGEKLSDLASFYYGHSGLWRLIAVANNIDNPSQIPAGTLLQIPPLTALRG